MNQKTTVEKKPKYVDMNGLKGMLEYLSTDVSGNQILIFKGYDNNAGRMVQNLYTVNEAAEIFGTVARRLA